MAIVRYITDNGYISVETGENTYKNSLVEIIIHQKDRDGNWKILYQAAGYPEFSAVE